MSGLCHTPPGPELGASHSSTPAAARVNPVSACFFVGSEEQ